MGDGTEMMDEKIASTLQQMTEEYHQLSMEQEVDLLKADLAAREEQILQMCCQQELENLKKHIAKSMHYSKRHDLVLLLLADEDQYFIDNKDRLKTMISERQSLGMGIDSTIYNTVLREYCEYWALVNV